LLAAATHTVVVMVMVMVVVVVVVVVVGDPVHVGVTGYVQQVGVCVSLLRGCQLSNATPDDSLEFVNLQSFSG
jgi:hypothetical protein